MSRRDWPKALKIYAAQRVVEFHSLLGDLVTDFELDDGDAIWSLMHAEYDTLRGLVEGSSSSNRGYEWKDLDVSFQAEPKVARFQGGDKIHAEIKHRLRILGALYGPQRG